MKKIGIVGCSDGLSPEKREKIQALTACLTSKGFAVEIAKYVFEDERVYPGNGKLRAQELMNFYRDPEMTCIFDVTGGNQGNEVIADLDYEVIKNSPALYWGYSDLSTVINAIYTKTGKKSYLYSPKFLVGDQAEMQQTRFEAFLDQLKEKEAQKTESDTSADAVSAVTERVELFHSGSGVFIENSENEETKKNLTKLNISCVQGASCEGILVGGNIRCFLKLAGTEYFPDLTDKILLLEAWSGGLPQVLTFLNQYKQLGAFSKVRGILLGTFTEMEKKQIQPVITELVKDIAGPDVPIFSTREVGHGHDAKAAVIGGYYQLHA